MNCLEFSAYFIVFISSLLYSLFSFYHSSQDQLYNTDHNDYEKDCWFFWMCDRYKDVTDLEWQVSKNFYLGSKSLYLLFHSLGFYIVRKLCPKQLSTFVITYTSFVIIYLLSIRYLLLIYLNILIIFSIEYVQKILNISHKRYIHYVLFVASIIAIHKVDAHLDSEKNLLIQVCFSWLSLKCLSSSLDAYEHDLNSKLKLNISEEELDVSWKTRFAYLLYFPPFFFGPIYQYSDFAKYLNKIADKNFPYTEKDLFKNILQFVRYLFWAAVLEFATHFIYSSSFQYYVYITEKFDSWSLCGFGFALTIVFYVKYLVIYGISMSMSEIDGFRAVIPKPPECIAHIHQTSYLWRKFDKGLYFFLVKYFYKPITGSNHTNPLRKIFAGFVCFTIIAIWHGYYDAVIVWVSINLFLSFLEITAMSFRKSSFLKNIEKSFSETNQLRLEALIGAPYLALAYLSNIFFLSNYESGLTLFNNILLGFPIPLLPTLFIFYCGCHVSKYINQRIKYNEK